MKQFATLVILFTFSSNLTAVILPGHTPKLSQTGLGLADVKEYSPQYPLWTDGAKKRRWIQLPKGSTIHAADPDRWIFPIGTKLWKEFAYETGTGLKRIETRFIEKTAKNTWEFSTYEWIPDGSDADLVTENGKLGSHEIAPNVFHNFPGIGDCRRCHARGGDPVLGFDLLQLSDDRDPLAPHTEPLGPESLTLNKLVEMKWLNGLPHSAQYPAPRIHARNEIGRAAMGYLHSNCGSCHNPKGSATVSSMDLMHRYSASYEKDEPAFKTTVGVLSSLAIPGMSKSFRIEARFPERSTLYYRLHINGEYRMPPIGSGILDPAGQALLHQWIASLNR